jgi:hypothetical protein
LYLIPDFRAQIGSTPTAYVLLNKALQRCERRRSAFFWRSQVNAGTLVDETATMSAVRLSIKAELCGEVSVGTVRVIRLVSQHARVALSEAMGLVDRCVFDGETVLIPMPSSEDASLLVRALSALPAVPKIEASVEE